MKPLYLLVGKSASGKTTVAEYLEKERNMTQVQSYTTRPPRKSNEAGHIFVSNDEFNQLVEVMAYTEYNGYKYCCTKKQLDEADVYVVDPIGVSSLMYNYKSNRDIHILFFSADIRKRMARMKSRGSSDDLILQRIENDNEYNWWNTINKIVSENDSLYLHKVNANLCKEEVFEVVEDIIFESSNNNHRPLVW